MSNKVRVEHQVTDFHLPNLSPHQISFSQKKNNFPSKFLRAFRTGPSVFFYAADSPLWATNLGPTYDSTISSIYALGSSFVGFLEHLGRFCWIFGALKGWKVGFFWRGEIISEIPMVSRKISWLSWGKFIEIRKLGQMFFCKQIVINK